MIERTLSTLEGNLGGMEKLLNFVLAYETCYSQLNQATIHFSFYWGRQRIIPNLTTFHIKSVNNSSMCNEFKHFLRDCYTEETTHWDNIHFRCFISRLVMGCILIDNEEKHGATWCLGNAGGHCTCIVWVEKSMCSQFCIFTWVV